MCVSCAVRGSEFGENIYNSVRTVALVSRGLTLCGVVIAGEIRQGDDDARRLRMFARLLYMDYPCCDAGMRCLEYYRDGRA